MNFGLDGFSNLEGHTSKLRTVATLENCKHSRLMSCNDSQLLRLQGTQIRPIHILSSALLFGSLFPSFQKRLLLLSDPIAQRIVPSKQLALHGSKGGKVIPGTGILDYLFRF